MLKGMRAEFQPILERYGRDRHYLVQILREIQELEGWLQPEILTGVAATLGLPRAQVEGVAGFYSFFHTRPAGRFRILWSDNITDRMLGAPALLEQMCRTLWVERGKTSEDGLVSVDTTSCTGMCDQGPAILVNGWAVTRMTAARVDHIVSLVRDRVPLERWPGEFFLVADHIRREDALLGGQPELGSALRAALKRGSQATIDEIKRSGLRGRGGAGFSAAQKWQSCREAPAEERYVVCNADEGEPGTFKDRVLLTAYADLVFEGMTVAGYAIGARRGLLYLRGEYRYLLSHLESVLERRRTHGLLGHGIEGDGSFDFDIEIHLGAGAYVCGEESALIESLEGKRGTPRIRPPFPVTHGYLGRPTVVNNVETLAAAALVALRGGDWYAGLGTRRSAGTKVLSVSGDCERPGIYEYPFGVTVQQVLEDCGALHTQAVQVSGPSGTCLEPGEFGRRIAFEDVPTAGAFMVFDRRRDMFEVARNFAHFFAHESCGFCTPCRVGTSALARMMDKIADGHGSPYELNEIFKLNRVLQSSSHCGLGHTACNPLFDTLNKFRPAYERRLRSLDFEPAFDLDASLARARQMTGRDDPGAHLETAAT
jgi:[NiFe] hydrogenase diaphorase moiety large subunit